MQILSRLSEQFLSTCGQVAESRRLQFKVADVIYTERPRDTTFVVLRGYVRSLYVQPDGRTWTRMIFGKGALLGDLPFRPDYFVSDEQLVANGAVSLMQTTRQALELAATSNPEFELLLLKTLSAQLQFLDRRMHWQLITPLRSRIARVLEDLMCFSAEHCGHGHLVDVRITHEEFSQLVVAARPAVSEILKEFKAAGVIDYTRSHLCLLQMEKLHSIARAVS